VAASIQHCRALTVAHAPLTTGGFTAAALTNQKGGATRAASWSAMRRISKPCIPGLGSGGRCLSPWAFSKPCPIPFHGDVARLASAAVSRTMASLRARSPMRLSGLQASTQIGGCAGSCGSCSVHGARSFYSHMVLIPQPIWTPDTLLIRLSDVAPTLPSDLSGAGCRWLAVV